MGESQAAWSICSRGCGKTGFLAFAVCGMPTHLARWIPGNEDPLGLGVYQ